MTRECTPRPLPFMGRLVFKMNTNLPELRQAPGGRRLMTMTYHFIDFDGYAKCRFVNDIYWSSIRKTSCSFKPGAYALTGQIDDGGWVLSYSLAPIKKKDVYINRWANSGGNEIDLSRFYIDDKEVSLAYLQSVSCHLGYHNKNKFAACNKSARKQLTKAIKKGTSKYSFVELQEMFGLSDARIDRPLYMTNANQELK